MYWTPMREVLDYGYIAYMSEAETNLNKLFLKSFRTLALLASPFSNLYNRGGKCKISMNHIQNDHNYQTQVEQY